MLLRKMQKSFEELGKEAMKYNSTADSTSTAEPDSQPEEKAKTKNEDEDIVDADFEVVDDETEKESK